MIITRREFSAGAAALAFAASAGLDRAFAQAPQTVSSVVLMAPHPLGEMSIGNEKAQVTVIEYASMTCSHCAAFATETFPRFKKEYVDTGKVRFILREFPLDPQAAAAFLLARCAANGDANKYFALVDTLFHQQRDWAVQNAFPKLVPIMKQAGMTQKQAEECLANQKSLEGIETVRSNGATKLGVNATPTFFINGERVSGALTYDQMVAKVTPYLKAG